MSVFRTPVSVRVVGSAYDRPVPGNLDVFTRIWYEKSGSWPGVPGYAITWRSSL